MHRKNAEMMTKVDNVTKALSMVAEVKPPSVPAVHSKDDVDANALLIAEKIAEQLIGDNIGRAEIVPQGLRCTFFDKEKDFGIMNHTYRNVRHTHVIARPKDRRYPFHGSIPKKGQQIIDTLCEAGLQRQIRIVTGDLIGEDVRKVKEWKERTAFGSFIDSSGAAILAGAAAVGTAIVTGGAALAALPATFAADPCILVGDLCLYGWVD
ncbi:hypothetical protein RMSM_03518 [Rhodopirellula maiorica SM1]|uniref:Uncharacterized protein n=2 Tax=Novipirellula TaxID=2795426 RepID=M5RJR0_9BACT|nr:hypothetical protein RMSM_03518 [Rhodopirellula maiorica SM1]